MMPFIVLGLITLMIALITKNALLLHLSIYNISGCAGDIITFLFLLKLKNDIEFTEFDDVTSFAIYSNKDLSTIKHFGLKYVGTKDDVARNELKKIKISVGSKKIMIGILLFMLASFLIGLIVGLLLR